MKLIPFLEKQATEIYKYQERSVEYNAGFQECLRLVKNYQNYEKENREAYG